jgi:hypothetical protein
VQRCAHRHTTHTSLFVCARAHSDVHPIRHHWANKVYNESAMSSSPYWMKGSQFHGRYLPVHFRVGDLCVAVRSSCVIARVCAVPYQRQCHIWSWRQTIRRFVARCKARGEWCSVKSVCVAQVKKSYSLRMGYDNNIFQVRWQA